MRSEVSMFQGQFITGFCQIVPMDVVSITLMSSTIGQFANG